LVAPLVALLVEELVSHSADEALETVVVDELLAEQVEIAVACVLVHHRQELAALDAVLHNSRSNSSSHVCCASCTLRLNDRDHRNLGKMRPCTVSICIRCTMGANAVRVRRGRVVHKVLRQLPEVMSSHSLEREAAAVLGVDIRDWEQRAAAADETGSVALVLGLQRAVRRAHEAGWAVAARRFADAETLPFALCCSMAVVAVAEVELEGLLADCVADLGRWLLAAAALLAFGFH
jgi:hypothetical protein